MKLKRYVWIALCLFFFVMSVLPVYSQQRIQSRPGFQVSTLGALNVGIYQGASTLSELKQHGDFGLGTLDGLDGEMILLNGKAYQIKADGKAYPVADDAKTPFSAVTFFRKERSLRLTGKMTYDQLQQEINKKLPTSNLPYAIRIKGTFPALKVRSVPKQTPPYQPLKDVVSQQQRLFELQDVQGTLVGFRLPQFLDGINVTGYHFHLLTNDRQGGGHLLEGEFLDPIVDVEILSDWQMIFPRNTAFEQATLE